jgi:drug/metabolite transporter (DMT)-like permease
MPLSVIGQFVLLASLWGSSFLFMSLGAVEFGPVATAGMRVGLAMVFLLPFLLRPAVRASLMASPRPILFVGLLNSALPFVFFGYAVLHIPTGLTGIINATAPLTGAFVAWLWLKESPGFWRSIGLATGFVGVSLLVLGKSGVDASGQVTSAFNASAFLAMAAGLGATLCYGIAASFTRKHLGHVHPQAMAVGSHIGASIALVVPTILFWPCVWPSQQAWAAIGAVALLSSAIAYVLFFKIMAQVGPSKALTVTFLVPVFALFYGAVFLDEVITAWMLMCGAVILMGTALSMGLVRKP